MNALTRIVNALAFANAGNQHEFNILLRQVDSTPASRQDAAPRGPSTRSDVPPAAPGIRHAQGAL